MKKCELVLITLLSLLFVSCTARSYNKRIEPTIVTMPQSPPTIIDTRVPGEIHFSSPTKVPETKGPIAAPKDSKTDKAETSAEALADRLYVHFDGVLWAIDRLNDETGLWQELENIIQGPGKTNRGSWKVRFANFADRMAYIDAEGRIWMADLRDQDPVLIYQGGITYDNSYLVEMTWSPDDAHLFINLPDEIQEQDILYHVAEQKSEPWVYRCDHLALSPRSNQMAVWCSPHSTEAVTFAILEWGGEIWLSQAAPASPLVSIPLADPVGSLKYVDLFPIYWQVGWSVNGERIAYFDLVDGSLHIIDRAGKLLQTFPSLAYSLADSYKIGKILPPRSPVQWSWSGERLLVFADGGAARHCPVQVLPESEGQKRYKSSACWQVIEAEMGKIIWHPTGDMMKYVENAGYEYWDASLSWSGDYLAFSRYCVGLSSLNLVNLRTGKISEAPFNSINFRWGR